MSGSPFPDVFWYKGQRPLVTCRGGQRFQCRSKKPNKYEVDDGIDVINRGPRTPLSFEIIDPVHPDDNGEHRVKVQSVAGEYEVTFNVSVTGECSSTYLSIYTILGSLIFGIQYCYSSHLLAIKGTSEKFYDIITLRDWS